MDKTEIVNKYSTDSEQRVLLSHIYDLWSFRNDRNIIRTSDFLSEKDVYAAKKMLNAIRAADYFIYGGYNNAERCCVIFLPDYFTAEDVTEMPSLAELTYVRVSVSKYDAASASITHRDVLGSLMALGIERCTVGDIVSDGKSAVFLVKTKLSDFIKTNLNRVGRYSVDVEILERCEITPSNDYEEGSDTVASMRLDAVISGVFKLSRSYASELISGGLVTVNGISNTKPDSEVKAGDKLTLRGKGKAIVDRLDGTSKKGRIRFVFRRYK